MTRTSTSVDRLAVSQSIRDGETLVSAGGITELGFFSPGNSARRYLGLWFRNVSPLTVVWVANRNTPLHNNSGVLKLNEKGILELLNATNSTIWSSNISSKAVNNPIAYVLDSGNFVVKYGQESNEGSVVWQSFDYPEMDTSLSSTLHPRIYQVPLQTIETGMNSAQASEYEEAESNISDVVVQVLTLSMCDIKLLTFLLSCDVWNKLRGIQIVSCQDLEKLHNYILLRIAINNSCVHSTLMSYVRLDT
ncbi:G-type lectin S-receptor serine/threonine-protein kinase [Spatholobus suberectus]|nr:G-type lectin S-receptor serine/threonine-protein kinase [Spatholobus suberectus]